MEEIKISSVARQVEVGGKQFWFDVGKDGSADGWIMDIRSSRGLVSRLRGKTDPVELAELCLRIDEALKQDEKIEDIEWLTFDEWLERP